MFNREVGFRILVAIVVAMAVIVGAGFFLT